MIRSPDSMELARAADSVNEAQVGASRGSGSFCITSEVAVGIRYVSKSRYWRLPSVLAIPLYLHEGYRFGSNRPTIKGEASL